MAIALNPKAQEVLEDLPNYYAGSAHTSQALNALACELQRVEDMLETFRSLWFAQRSDDTYRLLGIWELMLNLPVEVATATVEERRADVLASLRGRDVAEGRDWTAIASEVIGGPWTHIENYPEPYDLTVRLPFVNAVTQLDGAISLPLTVIKVDSATGFPTAGSLLIGTELVAYSGAANAMAAPASPAATPSASGGTLSAGTRYYKITARNPTGETVGSSEVSAVVPGGGAGSVELTWAPVPGATSYRIYRGTAPGAENVYYTATEAAFTDTGGASTAGSPPGANSTYPAFFGASGGTGSWPDNTAVKTADRRAGRVEALLRTITPAHLNIVSTYGEGFIVGISIVGEEAI